MGLVIVTGMSGSGKATALRIFEDNGYYCVDNLPIDLIEKFSELIFNENSNKDNVALGVDIRSGDNLTDLPYIISKIRQERECEVLFLDCSNDILIKRFKETRRSHPMGDIDTVENELNAEREKLSHIRKHADYIIDTSGLLVRDLTGEINNIFNEDKEYKNLFVTVMSFGFKNGIPMDCDLVFDVRFLPNPYYVPELRGLTGEDEVVREYVLNSPITTEFLNKLNDMVKFLIPNYIKEGKNQLVIGIGCTGGHHRSVTIAKKLYEELNNPNANYGIRITHRDIKK